MTLDMPNVHDLMIAELKKVLAGFPEFKNAVKAIEEFRMNDEMTLEQKKGAYFALMKLLDDYSDSVDVDGLCLDEESDPELWKKECPVTAFMMRKAGEPEEQRKRRAQKLKRMLWRNEGKRIDVLEFPPGLQF